MPPAQSSPVPDTGKALRLKDAGWAVPLTLKAFVRLIAARLAFSRLEARELPQRNAAAARADKGPEHADELLADRIGFVIARLAKRLPWRSDCMIQAIAAQEWLAELGMASELRIGVERPEDGPFGAHAWLVRGERIITGGDISRYAALNGIAGKISDL
ncbi:MAG: lasso peptide biosynthesis B2 protein [Porphyrobacter sp.]|nr:lasso peptide biosynthesis B2 protein [Porphyrobacter sp.]